MSTPTRPPSAPQWQHVGGVDSKPKPPPTEPTAQAKPQAKRKAKPSTKSTSKPESKRKSKATSKQALEAQATAGAPQRRAETGLTDASTPSVSALQVMLTRAKNTVVPPVGVRKDERDAERRKATRRRHAIVWGRRFGYVVVLAAAVWLVLLSPVFALDPGKVEVSGYGSVVDPTEVRAAVNAQEGKSLATLSVSHLTSELKDIPGVREAHVARHWPDGLVVTLVSREPVAALPDSTGGVTLVDDQGVQVGRAERAPKGLPTLSVPTDKPKVLTAALNVMSALPADLSDRVKSVSAATEDSVQFTLANGPLVEWGSAEDSALKAQVLGLLLGSKQARKADVIDVSAPTLPITKSN